MKRVYLLIGLTGAMACVRAPGGLELLPEPNFIEVEPAAAVVDTPVLAYAPDDPIRDVVYTDPGELPRLEAAGVALPLRRTAVRAHLRGSFAEVVVTQRFVNEQRGAIEAIYTFPLPENSAVTAMKMIVGARVIEAEIRERGAARQVYGQARDAGHTAALLEQERPDVFTQSLANIPPGEAIDVEIRYMQTLSYDAGEYEFVFPTVVGPRYLPGEARGRSGSGTADDTDRVPDASRVSPPVLGLGQRSGHDLEIDVTAEAGSPITAWAAPAHAVEVLAVGDRLHVRLARRDAIANRDFVLRYRSAAAQPAARLFLGPPGPDGGYFMLLAEPPRLDVDRLVGRRELIFVADVSGSMEGAPLGLVKATLRAALASARPVDTFDVVVFAGRTARLFGAPRPANAANIHRALEFIDGLDAGGGTEMGDAVHAALVDPVADGRHRYVFFLTDGYIGEEAAIARDAAQLVAQQKQHGRRARVFGVGVGEAPNSALIAGLSRAGEGVARHVRGPDDVARAVAEFRRDIDSPVLTDVRVDWGPLAVTAVEPGTVPDLFASQPLVLHGRFRGAAPTSLQLHGVLDRHDVTIPIVVTAVGEREELLAGLWVRSRVDSLELARTTTSDVRVVEQAGQQILALGLSHHLVTAFTSLVAVDRSRRHGPPLATVVQPVELPRGMSTGGTRVMMGEVRNIPVGGTSRDFTAVVDMAPTAARDSAGVRIAGTTGAESRYIVDGASVSRATRRSSEIQRLEQAVRASEPRRWTGPAVQVHARPRLRGVTAPTSIQTRALRERLQAEIDALAICFTAAARSTYRVRRRLHLSLLLGVDGGILELVARGRGPLDADIDRCLRERLAPALRATLGGGGRVELELAVWMQH